MPLPYRNTAANLALRTLIERNRSTSLGADLGTYLRRVAQATVLGVALSACGSSHTLEDAGTDTSVMADTSVMGDVGPTDTSVPRDTSVRPDTAVPDAMVEPGPFCTEDGQWDALSAVQVSRGDYVALLSQDIYSFGGPGFYTVTQESGVACETATDRARCQAELERLRAETNQRALLFTTHDGAYAITDGFTAMELMGGDVDTPNEAALLAWFAGYEIHCTGPNLTTITPRGDGWHVVAYRYDFDEVCDVGYYRAELYVDGFEGTVEPIAPEEYMGILTTLCAIGRRPAGLARRIPAEPVAPVADFFAEVTRLEESAVAAFDIMIDELTRLGAPEALLVAAREARADEVRHTASMGAIARAYGTEPARPELTAMPRERTLFEIALENAVEGCVRETYGALVAAHQALRAEDPRIATAMDTVASDEIRHAELSWALAAWLEPQLTDDERAQIETKKREAITQIAASAYAPVHPSLVALAGMPDADANGRMVAELTRDLWN